MEVHINAQQLHLNRTKRNSGLSRYIFELLKQLLKMDSNIHYQVYSNEHLLRKALKGSNADFRITSNKTIFQEILWEHLRFPKYIKKNDIVFSPAFTLPYFASIKKSVIIIPDLIFKSLPQTCGWRRRFYLNLAVKKSVKKASYIISTSKATKRDILKYYDVPRDKIRVTYLGCNKNFYPRSKAEIEAIKKKYNLSDYFLFIGNLEPRKNLVSLMNAFSKLPDANTELIIGGPLGWKYEHILKTQSKFKNIKLIGYVDEHDLPAMYSGAKSFLFPSLQEGFGLPVLEAMSCGAPVLCSNTSSLPEVGGKAAYYVNPYSIESIREGLETLNNNELLRKKMIQEGLRQAKRFSWKESAKQINSIFEELA